MNTDTTSLPTNSVGYPGPHRTELPPLAYHRPRDVYKPQYGDYVIWSKWFSCWHGIVKHFDEETGELHIIFGGVPFILFTMSEQQQEAETVKIKLSEIRSAKNGKFAIQQQDRQANQGIWYI
jgi:hypothetical protein